MINLAGILSIILCTGLTAYAFYQIKSDGPISGLVFIVLLAWCFPWYRKGQRWVINLAGILAILACAGLTAYAMIYYNIKFIDSLLGLILTTVIARYFPWSRD